MTGLLEVRGLTVRFGGVVALDGVDLDVEAGSVVGLIGPNGAGKTTLIDAVCGFVPCSGMVTLARAPLHTFAPHERARAGLARTFQSLELFDDLTVRENLLVPAEHDRWWSIGRDLLRPSEGHGAGAAVDEALRVTGLTEQGERLATELSSHERGLVALARALAGRPRVLLLDEPAAGLDDAARTSLGERLRVLAGEGVGVLLVDHDMTLVLGTCDRVTVLDVGRVIAQGPPDEVRSDPAVVEAYLGSTTT